MPTPDSSIITQLVRSMALTNNQVGLQQTGRKPNNTFGAQQYNSSRPSTKKVQPLPLNQQIGLLFNQLNNPSQITQTFFNTLNESLKNQVEPSLIPITSSELRSYYNNNNLPSTINFLGTTNGPEGQTFPLNKLTSGEYFAFSNTYPTIITNDSITYKLTVISSGADAGKLRIESKDLLNTSYTSINNSPFDKGQNFNLGSNTYYYAGAGSSGIIFSTIPFPNITVNVSDFLGINNTVDPNNVTNDSISGTISNTLGSEKLCFPTNLSLGVTPNTFILHDRKRIAKISVAVNPSITTLYTFDDASTAYYPNMNCSCIQKDDNTFFWNKPNSNLLYYTDNNFATESFIGDYTYQPFSTLYTPPPTDNPPQFGPLTKLIFNKTKTKIYIPDLYVSLLRIVDISDMANIRVQTVKDLNGNNVNFNKVIDVKEYDDNNLLLSIQTLTGGNQLIIFDINTRTINRIYGNGEYTWVDSDKDNSSIAGNTGIEMDYANKRVYFSHDGSGIRMLDLETGNFYTIAGSTLGYVNNGQLSKFNKIMGILYDNTTQSLYLCDGANYRIRKVKLVLQNPTPIVECNYASEFNGLHGIAIDSSGNLYVTNFFNNTVSKVDTSRNVTTYASGFNGPFGITIDSSGNLYVSNNRDNTISKVDINRNVTTYASGFNGPFGIAIDSSGNFYVCNAGNDTISKVDTNRNVTTYASGFNGPLGITIDSSGNLYVSNNRDNTISKVDINRNVTTYASGFNLPLGITIDSSGNLYVCNYNSGVVCKVDTSRNVTTYAPSGGPYAITIDSSSNLYVTNILDSKICKISPPSAGGNTVVTITQPNPNPNPNPNPIVDCNYASGFNGPYGITRDSSGNLYVINTNNGTISKVDTSRNVTTYASGFNYPYGITIDSSGNLYVANYGDNTVSKVDTSRNVTTYASGFNAPYGITIDSSGNLYVTNLNIGTISKVDTSRNVTTYASGFNGPYGIAIDSSNNLYVTNGNITTISKVDTNRNVTTYASGFNSPFRITIDSSGNLYVCNAGNDTVSKVDTNRNVTTYAPVRSPYGITIDSSSNLYVINLINGTVCKITPPDIGTYHIQFRVIGVTPGNITEDMKNNFKNDFAALIGVDPAMLTIELRSGSLVVNISFNASYGANGFSDNDCALIKNTTAILNQVSISDIEKIKNDRNIDFTWSIDAYIDYENIKINIDVGLINTINSRFNNYDIQNALVGDIKNNCMYTIIGSIVVRINRNGTISRIALFPESQGCRYIFIDSTSSFLVIPSNVQDTTSAGAINNSLKSNKVYIIRLSDGIVFTKTLNQLYLTGSNCGFNQFNNRFYYTSFMASPNYLKLCYIPITLSNETLTATYTTLSGGDRGKIEFIDNNTGFISGANRIHLLNFSNNTSSIIAGQEPVFGRWSNITPPNGWENSNGNVYGPYLDAPIGTNAFFSYIEDTTYDSENNRLLVTDTYAQRIRSVDLRSGNNYAVTTLAGTSPVLYGQAINGPNTTYSPSVLASLGQVGIWNNGTNQMPQYTKVNSSYSNSTFNRPRMITIFKGKIYVVDNRGTRQLVNNRVSDFIPFANDITKITLGSLGGGPSITFTISNSNFTLSDTEKQSFINEFMKSYPSINKDNLVFTFTSGSIVVNIKYKDTIDVTTLSNEELTTIQNLEVGFSDKVEVLANFRTAITTTTFISGSINLDVGGQTSTITGEIIITIPSNLIDYIDRKIPNKISPFFLQFGNDGTIYTTNGLNDVLSVDRRFGFTNKICTLPPPTIPNTTRRFSSVIGIDSLNRYLIVRDSLMDNTNTNVSLPYFYIVDISTKISYQIKGSDFATGISGYNSSINISSITFNKFNDKIYMDIRFLQNNAYPLIGYFSGSFDYSTKTFSLDSNTPLSNFNYNLASNYSSIANPTGTNSSNFSSTSFTFINANEYICIINKQICRFNINTNLLTKIIGEFQTNLTKFNPNRNVEETLWGKFNYQGPILFSSVSAIDYNSISDTLFMCDSTAKVMLSISPILGTGIPAITKIYGTPNIDLDAQGYPNSSLTTNPIEPGRFFLNNVTGNNKGTLTPNTLNFISPFLVVQNLLDNRIYIAGYSSKLIRNPSSLTEFSETYENTVIVGNKAIIYKINITS